MIAKKIIGYLQDKNKVSLISDISKCLADYVNSNINIVTVVSARSLTTEQRKKVEIKFSKLTGSTHFDFIIEPGLLGGILVKYNDKTWDLSLKGTLDRMKFS